MTPHTRTIITWWFAAPTPIRRYKLARYPGLQEACQQVSQDFVPPSGAVTLVRYRYADKEAFAKAVLMQLNARQPLPAAP